MKNLLFILLFIPFLGMSQTQATLLYNWDDPTIVGSNAYNNAYNEIWGIVANDKEFAVIGSTKGTHFFDLSDMSNPQELTNAFVVPGVEGGSIIHRDYHDYQCYLYAVADEGFSSTLQIIDYSDLPNSTTVVYDSNTEIRRAHNIFIDTAQAVLYAVFVDKAGGQRQNMMIYSLADPINPSYIATYNNIGGQTLGGAHDIYVRDGLAYINCGYNGLVIADFTDPTSPQFRGVIDTYIDQGYNHSGWLSDDGNYYFLADETHNKAVKVLDVSDPTNIQVLTTIDAGPGASTFSIPHNIITRGNYCYISYYYDGVQVYDFTNPNNPSRVAYYDTYSGADNNSYEGAWGVFPYLPSGNILVSDMQTGLYVFQKIDQSITGAYPPLGTSSNCEEIISSNEEVSALNSIQIAPQPASDQVELTLELLEYQQAGIQLVDLTGKTVQQFNRHDLTEGTNTIHLEIKSTVASGMYLLQISGDQISHSEKVIINK